MGHDKRMDNLCSEVEHRKRLYRVGKRGWRKPPYFYLLYRLPTREALAITYRDIDRKNKIITKKKFTVDFLTKKMKVNEGGLSPIK